jgi:hypothetical protein
MFFFLLDKANHFHLVLEAKGFYYYGEQQVLYIAAQRTGSAQEYFTTN